MHRTDRRNEIQKLSEIIVGLQQKQTEINVSLTELVGRLQSVQRLDQLPTSLDAIEYDGRYKDGIVMMGRLLEARDIYNGEWIPKKGETKFVFSPRYENGQNVIAIVEVSETVHRFYFKTEELAQEFLKNFQKELCFSFFGRIFAAESE